MAQVLHMRCDSLPTLQLEVFAIPFQFRQDVSDIVYMEFNLCSEDDNIIKIYQAALPIVRTEDDIQRTLESARGVH